MATITRDELAAQLYGRKNDIEGWPGLSPANQEPFLKQAKELLPVVNYFAEEAFLLGFRDGVLGTQYMTGCTDETVQAVFEKEGLVDPGWD
jgi:hypothetical protein